jgi:hypothetical protein
MTDPKRYSEEEIAEILQRATAVEGSPEAGASPGHGLTLAELQEIGVEAGISPERIADAARAVRSRPPGQGEIHFLGAPRSVSRVVSLAGPFTDDDWTRLVVELRETFDAMGRIREEGPLRSWTNGNLRVLVEPEGQGHRVRMRTVKGNVSSLSAMASTFLALGVLMFVLGFLGELDATGFVMSLAFGLAGLGQLAYVRGSLPGWARERAAQMEGLAERLRTREREKLP